LDASTNSGGITQAALAQAAILVLGAPTQPFSPEELDCLQRYVGGGGNLLVLGNEGGSLSGTHSSSSSSGVGGSKSDATSGASPAATASLNALLGDYGLRLDSDCVIQTAYTR
jgi:hypothetical protein